MPGFKRKRNSDGRPSKKPKVERSAWGKLRIVKPMKATEPLMAGRLVEFKFCQNFSISPSAGLIEHVAYRANSMYDPDYSGLGHQPLGFDQWLPTFFNHYCVVKSTISVQAYSPGHTSVASNTYMIGVNLVDTPASLISNTVTSMMERPKSTYKMLANSNSGQTIQKVVKTFDAKRFFHKSDVVGDKDLRGGYNYNPNEEAIFQVWAGAANGSNDPSTITGIVTIIYTARLMEPVIPGQS